MSESPVPSRVLGESLVRSGHVTVGQWSEMLSLLEKDPALDLRAELVTRGWVTKEALENVSGVGRALPGSTGTVAFPQGGPTGTLVTPAASGPTGTVVTPAATGPSGTVAMPGGDPQYRTTLKTPESPLHLPPASEAAGLSTADGIPAEVASASALERNHFGKYILIRVLGSGGMAVVHKAWDTLLQQFVALKFLRTSELEDAGPEEGKRAIDTFLGEARLAVKLNHPNIARVYEVGEIQGRHYMAQYFIDGPSLHEVIHGTKERSLETRFHEDSKRFVTILRDISEAMAYAHELQPPIIHRDLKPSNVMLDRSGRAYVVDFGLAKEVKAGSHSLSGYVKGTPKYMAPEQAEARSHAMDGRTDIWALGVILYEMLTGRGPFETTNLHDLLSMIVKDEPLWPHHVAGQGTAKVGGGTAGAAHVPRDLETVAMKCLQKDPRHRYQSARELVADLDKYLKGDPVSVPQHSAYWFVARQARRLRKHRATWIPMVALALLLGLGAWVLGRGAGAAPPGRGSSGGDAAAIGIPPEELQKIEGIRDAFLKQPSESTLEPLVGLLGTLGPMPAALARQGIGPWWQEYLQTRQAEARSLYGGAKEKHGWLDAKVRERAASISRDLKFAEDVLRRREVLGLPEADLRPTRDELAEILSWKGTFTLVADLHPWAKFHLFVDDKALPRDSSRQEDSTPVRIPDVPVGALRLLFSRDGTPGRLLVPEQELRDGAVLRVWGTLDHPVYHVD